MQELFQLIQGLRDKGRALPPKLKGCCKKKKEDMDRKVHEAELQEEEEEEEEENESGFQNDDIIEVKPATKPKAKDLDNSGTKAAKTPAVGTPVRRIISKRSTHMDEVLIVGESKSKEKVELEELMKKIRDLELASMS